MEFLRRRREFIRLLGGATLAWPLAARAQQMRIPYRIGFLGLLPGESTTTFMKSFLERLNELGYREGYNMIFDYRSADGAPERLPQLAADAVRASPDVLVTGMGTLAAKAAQAATSTIPIVFTAVGDPIGAGLVASLGRPGANVTGMSAQASDIVGKRLQFLQELVPRDKPVAVLLNPETPFSVSALQELRKAAQAGPTALVVFEARTADQVSAGFEAAVKAGTAGLVLLDDPLTLGLRRQIAELAARFRLPTTYTLSDFVEAGGLMSYGIDLRQMNRRAAEHVDKILKGARPGDLPVEQPTKFELVINLKAAKALSLTVPPTLLSTADEVIE
jgi:putative tryptophan/tyrosine transport system substrate-binding protein